MLVRSSVSSRGRVHHIQYLALALVLGACGEVASTPDAPSTLGDAPADGGGDDAPDAPPRVPALAVGSFTAPPHVTSYALDASGDAAPLRTLTPAGLVSPALATANGELFVASGDRVWVYAAGADGDASPVRELTGSMTGLAKINSIEVVGDELFVLVGTSSPSIRVFPATADGDVAPIRIIAGNLTELDAPLDIAIGGGELFVANNGPSTVTVYPVAGNGNIAPLRTLTGGISRPSNVTVVGDELLVGGTSYIQAYARTDAGVANPLRIITGPATGLDFSYDVCVHAGEIYTLHRNANSVLVYPLTGDGDITPTRTISGDTTTLAAPQACVVIP